MSEIIIRMLRNISIKKRLFIGFCLVSVVPVTILILVLGISFYDTSIKDYKVQAVQTLGEMQYRTELLMEDQKKILDEFASDSDIIKNLRKIELGINTIDETIIRKNLQNQLLTDVNKGEVTQEQRLLITKEKFLRVYLTSIIPVLPNQYVKKLSTAKRDTLYGTVNRKRPDGAF